MDILPTEKPEIVKNVFTLVQPVKLLQLIVHHALQELIEMIDNNVLTFANITSFMPLGVNLAIIHVLPVSD